MIKSIISFLITIFIIISPAQAARDTNSFDGNIYPIYAGNGSLVPPASSIEQSLKNNRTFVIIYYLDDSYDSKKFAAVVSGLKLLWSSSIDLIPLTTDEIQGERSTDPSNPSYYWHGKIPQTVVINGAGDIILDKEGQVPIMEINQAISKATGLEPPEFNVTIKSFNEYSSEPSKEGYDDPRK